VPSQVLATELLRGVDDRWLARRGRRFDGQRGSSARMLRRAMPAWRWREPDGGLGCGSIWATSRPTASSPSPPATAWPWCRARSPAWTMGRHHLRSRSRLPEPVLATGAERLALAWEALGSGAVGNAVPADPV
jgi:hypothetical protein